MITRARLVRWLAVALVLAAGCYLALAAARLVLAYREMLTAERQLLSAEAVLRESWLDPSPAALAGGEGPGSTGDRGDRAAPGQHQGEAGPHRRTPQRRAPGRVAGEGRRAAAAA